ncbi:MAG: MASE1 domain-containing protein [Pseudomonadota bacterium]
MEDQPWKWWGLILTLSVVYCLAFLGLWRISLDQWYLPAGLRAACLLLLPIRYWPLVFIGEASALLYMRVPKAEQYSVQWAYLSPFLYIAAYSAVPYHIKSKIDTLSELIHKFPQVASILALWGCICAMAINYVLVGPRQTVTTLNFLSFTVGNYHGIIMVLLPWLLWVHREQWKAKAADGTNSIVVSILLIVILYMTATLVPEQQSAIQLMPLIFMILPVFYLTVVHGWHGAALGIIFVNVAIAMALPRTNIVGEFDGIILTAQVALAAITGGLLVVGSYISTLFDKTAAALLSEMRATKALREQEDAAPVKSKGLLQTLFRSTELRLRESALAIGASCIDMNSYRHNAVDILKDDGQYERAMDAQAAGMQAAKSLDMQRDHLYPLEIDTHGLYAALMGPAFHDVWRKHARVHQYFRGEQNFLSDTLRIAVYRAINRAMESMQDYAPNEYDIRARVWRRSGRSGATVLIIGTATCEPVALSQDAQDALEELHARAFAYDGVLKQRHPCRIRFMMTEDALSE